MISTLPAFIVTLAALVVPLAAGPSSAQEQAAGRTRAVYVSVQGRDGLPLTGLMRDDFLVREDDVTREVLTVERATAPVQIMLLVDDSAAADPMIADLRRGLNTFVDAMQGKAELGLVTIGERPTSVTELTSNVDAIKKGITRIFARSGSGAYFLEGLSDVARGLQRRESGRPHVVAVISEEGVEFSTPDAVSVLDRLYASRATLHVLAVGRPSGSMSDEMRQRNIAIADGTERTGGRRDQVLASSGLSEALKRVAAEILNQYLVTYGAPEALIPPERLEVSVKAPGATVRARTRVQAGK